jgi:carbon monoxide dehydrogenase subunit G
MAATPAEIYAFLAEPANLPRWQTGVISSERTSPGPTAAGSTGRVMFELMGQRVTAETVVREAVPDRRLVLATSASGMSVVGTLELAAADGGTQLSFSSEIKAENIFMAPLERMVADVAERDLDASLARLEAAIATADAADPP